MIHTCLHVDVSPVVNVSEAMAKDAMKADLANQTLQLGPFLNAGAGIRANTKVTYMANGC